MRANGRARARREMPLSQRDARVLTIDLRARQRATAAAAAAAATRERWRNAHARAPQRRAQNWVEYSPVSADEWRYARVRARAPAFSRLAQLKPQRCASKMRPNTMHKRKRAPSKQLETNAIGRRQNANIMK